MDFVDFNLAKKLKDKGFDWDRITTYNTRTKVRNNHIEPTISQVLKWLREEKKIYVSVEVEHEDWFEYKIVQLIKNTRCTGSHVYETYNDAILAGIKYILDNLI